MNARIPVIKLPVACSITPTLSQLTKASRRLDMIKKPKERLLLEQQRAQTIKGNGQKREYPVLFWPKTDVPENNSGRECCWPYLIGQPPLSPVFGHFMFRFWPFYVPFRRATRLLEQINMGHKNNQEQNFDQVT